MLHVTFYIVCNIQALLLTNVSVFDLNHSSVLESNVYCVIVE